MARSDKRYAVYPEQATIDQLGATCPQLNAALDRYALLQRLLAAPEPVQRAVWTIVAQMLSAVQPVGEVVAAPIVGAASANHRPGETL